MLRALEVVKTYPSTARLGGSCPNLVFPDHPSEISNKELLQLKSFRKDLIQPRLVEADMEDRR